MVMEVVFHDLFTGSGQLSGRTPDTIGVVPWTAPATIWPVAGGYVVEDYSIWNSYTRLAYPSADFLDSDMYVDFTIAHPGVNTVELALWFRTNVVTPVRTQLLLTFYPAAAATWEVFNENSNSLASGTAPFTSGTHNVKISMIGQEVNIYLDSVLTHTFTALTWPASGLGIPAVAGKWGITTGWQSVATEVKVNEFYVSAVAPPPPILPFWTNFQGQTETGYTV